MDTRVNERQLTRNQSRGIEDLTGGNRENREGSNAPLTFLCSLRCLLLNSLQFALSPPPTPTLSSDYELFPRLAVELLILQFP